MKIIYENVVKGLGDMVEEFIGEGMFILFGDNAPDTLKDFCYTIDVLEVAEDIKVGQTLVIDEKEYKITAVGHVARKNLSDLGHITLVFNGSEEAELPGSIYLEETTIPTLRIGSKISIIE